MSAPAGTRAHPRATTRSGPTLGRVLVAEWTKLLSLRSPVVVGVVTVAVTGALTHVLTSASSSDPGFLPTRDMTTALSSTFVGPLVLGVLVGTGEFSTGTFRSTFAAVPRRLPVLAAQTLVTAVFVLGVSVLAVAALVLGVLPAAASRDMRLDLLGDGIPQALLGSVGYLVGTALLGLAIGALLRRPVPALVTALLLVLVLPLAATLAADFASDPVAVSASGITPPATVVVNTGVTFSPVGAGSALTGPGGSSLPGAPELGMLGASLVMAVWVAVPLAAAAYRLRRRDLA